MSSGPSIGVLAGVPAWDGINVLADSPADPTTPIPGPPCDAWTVDTAGVPHKRGGLNLCRNCPRATCWLTRRQPASHRRSDPATPRRQPASHRRSDPATQGKSTGRLDQLPRGPGNRAPRCIHCDACFRQGRDRSKQRRPRVGCSDDHFAGTKSADNPAVRVPYCGRNGWNGGLGAFRWRKELLGKG